MKKRVEFVKVKVFFGYFTLVLLTSLIIWVVYTEILLNSKGRVDFNPSTNKFIHVNAILTNLYQAEGLERNYVQTGQISQDYLELMKTISMQIDTLVLMMNNQTQQINTYNIKTLLQVKQRAMKELFALKETNSSGAIYQKGLKKIPVVKNSLNHHPSAKAQANSSIFSDLPRRTTNSSAINKRPAEVSSSDSITGYLTAIMAEIRNEGDELETLQKQKEEEILSSDRSITNQLRQMLSYLEKEELVKSFQIVKDQQVSIKKATTVIYLLGSLALATIFIFLINILKDITKSQQYRKDLEVAKAYSEATLKSKEQFMLSLTHDIKSPLNSIIGFAGFMEQDKEVLPRHQKYLQNIRLASNFILKLVNDLLDLAKLEAGQLAIDQIPFELKRLISDLVEGFSPQALAKNIDLQLVLEDLPSEIYIGDPSRITQICSNLISNALNFTESGSVAVQVSTLSQSKHTDQIQVEVIDTGIGISEQNIHRVFEEFHRVRSSKKQYEGTGLGLTITKRMVDLLQGTITLKSKPGEGSHFTIVLPLERGTQIAGIAPDKGNDQDRAASGNISGLKIWLVDDDQSLLEMTSIILKSKGCEVFSFSDPQKAIDSFFKGCADLLITDIQMPEVDGAEVLKQIQKKNGAPITSLAISGRAPLHHEYDGFSAFILKPFQAHALIEAILGQQPEIIRRGKFSASKNTATTGYNLDQILAFAGGDLESQRQILASFIDSATQNSKLFRQYIAEENRSLVAGLAHKMLPLLRQVQAKGIVEFLVELETNDSSKLENEQYFLIGKLVIEKIETLLQSIRNKENIQLG